MISTGELHRALKPFLPITQKKVIEWAERGVISSWRDPSNPRSHYRILTDNLIDELVKLNISKELAEKIVKSV